MFSFNSVLIRTDVTSIKILENLIFVGNGAFLYIFDRITNKLIEKLEIFKGINIHGIEISSDFKFVFFHGRDALKLYNLRVFPSERKVEYISANKKAFCSKGSWVFSAKWLERDTRIAIVTANNKVSLWDLDLNLLEEIVCEERCLLYSAFLVNDTWNDLIVLSGTIFKEVLLWQPSETTSDHMCPIRKRLCGHKGVIFSVFYNSFAHSICSTSDDRTAIVWEIPTNDLNEALKSNLEIQTRCIVYGHLSRIFRCKVLKNLFFTGGEDGIINMWNLDGMLMKKFETQLGSQIWSLECDASNELLYAGGADGSVVMFPYGMKVKEEILVLPKNEVPKRVALLSNGNILTITGESVLYIYKINTQKWGKVRDSEDLKRYALLEVSKCRKLVSLSGFNGQIYIYKEVDKALELHSSYIMETKSRIFSFHWLSCYIFLVFQEGKLTLCDIEGGKIRELHKFVFPLIKDCWTTTACLGPDSTIIVGDRKGHLNIFKIGQENAIQTIKRAHNHLGITFVEFKGNKLTSLGRDAIIKVFLFNETDDKFHLSTSDKTPITWLASKVDDYIIAAFSGDDFVLWDTKAKRTIWQCRCGGGHRSFDFRKLFNIMCFTFIKNKNIFFLLSNWESILPKEIIPAFHIKEINALDYINLRDQIILVSGGEDTTMKISLIDKNLNDELKTISNFKSHLSSIRTVFITELYKNDKYLIFTGGGRAQIILWLLELKIADEKVAEIVCSEQDIFHDELDKEETEMRIMDIRAMKTDAYMKVFAACSDGNIKIFAVKFENGKYKLKFQQNIFYELRCILKIAVLQFQDLNILLTMSTDGMLVFWNVFEDESKILYSIKVHQSGINSYSSVYSGDLLFIVTGGDDNAIGLTCLRIRKTDEIVNIEDVSSWTDIGTHCTQVSGVFICDQYFLTVGVDARLAIFQWEFENELQCKFLNMYKSTVTDVQGMCCFQEKEYFSVFLYGRGLEFIKVQKNMCR